MAPERWWWWRRQVIAFLAHLWEMKVVQSFPLLASFPHNSNPPPSLA